MKQYLVRANLHVEYTERSINSGILFIFSLVYEYGNLEYVHSHVNSQGEPGGIRSSYSCGCIPGIRKTTNRSHAHRTPTEKTPPTPAHTRARQDLQTNTSHKRLTTLNGGNVKNTDYISTARDAICRSLEEPPRAGAAAAVVHLVHPRVNPNL